MIKRYPPETLFLSGLAGLVGLTTGIGILIFKRLIDLVNWTAFDWLGSQLGMLQGWQVIIPPVLGGLIIGLISKYLIEHEQHHGVAGIMESVALAGGRLRYERIPAKALASALSIGTGASVGPEDPSVQIGANAGSMFGQWLQLSDERRRILVAGGAAAAIAAAFNAPIAGVFFALEVILGEISGSGLGMIVISAVVSSVFTQAVSGTQPAFSVPTYAFNSAWELPLYLGLGLLAGLIAAMYVRLLYIFQDLFAKLPMPNIFKPAIAGLGVGLVGVFLPQIFGVGYQTIGQILAGKEQSFWLLIMLLGAKIVLTPLSLGGGFKGGVFAPALFLGAALGDAYGLLGGQLFPGLGIQPPAFAMVGMAALLAGAVHAPLTAILLLFEMTHDYRIILPLMFSVAVSLLIAQWLRRDSVYTLGLARKGIRLERGRDVEVLETLTAGEVMQTNLLSLPETDTLAQASEKLFQTRHHGAPVVDQRGHLVGMFTIQDLDRVKSEKWQTTTVGETCTRQPLVGFPDETIGTALRRMSIKDIGRLPIVERDNPRNLVGMLRRVDLVRAYDIALTRRASQRHLVQERQLDALTPESVQVTEVTIQPGAFCAGKRIKDIQWPRDCLIASLRHGRRTIIPHGNTQLAAGDVLVIVADEIMRQEVIDLCTKGGESL